MIFKFVSGLHFYILSKTLLAYRDMHLKPFFFSGHIVKEEASPNTYADGGMENVFRTLTAKVWSNLDNPIKSYDFSKFFNYYYCLLVCRPLRWHSATICDFTTVQLSNGTVYTFHRFLLFKKIHLPSTFILGYVRAKMTVHAFDQPDY